MSKNHNIASFVLRFTQDFWQDAAQDPHIRWRGHIKHVQGEDENRFTDFAEAMTFMQRHLTEMTMDTMASHDKDVSEEKVLSESFKLWEKFASGYTNMMFQAMEQGAAQSKAFQSQMTEMREKMLSAWQMPLTRPSDDDTSATMAAMQAQIEALTARVEELEQKLQTKSDQ